MEKDQKQGVATSHEKTQAAIVEPLDFRSDSVEDHTRPRQWSRAHRVCASVASWCLAFCVQVGRLFLSCSLTNALHSSFGIGAYIPGMRMIAQEYEVSMTVGAIGFAMFLFGIACVPVYLPILGRHIARSRLFLGTFFLFMLFELGQSRARNIATILVSRFFAGVVGAPSLVLVEMIFADAWPHSPKTLCLGAAGYAGYIGAPLGTLINGYVVPAVGDWRWTGYMTLIMSLPSFLMSLWLLKVDNHRPADQISLLQTIRTSSILHEAAQACSATFIAPVKLLVSKPLVSLIAVHHIYNYATLFQWFLTVPATLMAVHGFSLSHGCLAFATAVAGPSVGLLILWGSDKLLAKQTMREQYPIGGKAKCRLFGAMIGAVVMPIAFLWVGWSAKPSISHVAPIFGTGVEALGSFLCDVCLTAYLLDAYDSSYSSAVIPFIAILRFIASGALAIAVMFSAADISGAWTMSIFGFVGFALAPTPFLLYKYGPKDEATAEVVVTGVEGGKFGPSL